MTAQIFFQELQKLLSSIPKVAARIENSQNCYFCNNTYYSNNLFFCFDITNSKDSIFTYDSYMAVNCLDSDYVVECQFCYECVDCFKCFNCDYLSDDCAGMRDSAYCYYCANCHDVFGCVNLKNKSFCIFNRQLSEDEYKKLIGKYRQLAPSKVLKIVEQIKAKHPKPQVKEAYNINSPYGNYIYHNKNCYLTFDAGHNENCGYLYDSFYNKYCFDMTYATRYNEYSYQAVESHQSYQSVFVVNSADTRNSAYIFNCKGVADCFGCVGLRSRRFCLLNRQLTKEEYQTVTGELKKQLNNIGWGWNSLHIS